MKKFMYKVFTDDGIVLFESKLQAQAYITLLKENGETAFLNTWTWKTEIED